MIQKLRLRFIAIAMGAVVLVLGGIIAAIDVTNYTHVNRSADALLTVLAENGGQFPQNGAVPAPPPAQDDDAREEDDPSLNRRQGRQLSPEAPFDTRYFTVLLDENGTAVRVDTGRIAAVDQDDAKEMAAAVGGKTGGFYGDYKYTAAKTEAGTLYIFLDCGRDLSTFRSFLWTSLWVSVGGLALVFVLVLIFSKMVIAPVAESHEKQKRFITDSSHEIKTPLTIIDANTEVLEMEQGENEWTRSIRKQVARLSDLTQKLVLLARMDEAGASLPMVDFSLSDAVEEASEPYETVAAAAGKTLERTIQPGLTLRGEESSLRQVVTLLLDNAVKYSNPGGTVQLTLKSSGKRAVLVIRNTADGVENKSMNVLFERFYRADASRNSQTGGHGIGLSVAKAIVTAHKGRISAAGKEGKWVEFTVVL